jgi:hypothetical protein
MVGLKICGSGARILNRIDPIAPRRPVQITQSVFVDVGNDVVMRNAMVKAITE